MQPLNNIFLKISLLLLFAVSGKAAAQGSGTTGLMPEVTISQTVTFKSVAAKNMTQAVHAIIEKQNSLGESRIGKRIRKKKDPILIPYSLNKKSFNYC